VPTYQYRCTECGGELEAVQKFTDEPLTVHEDCGGRLRKVFSPVGIVFKGSGFYRTDSRQGSSAAEPASTSSTSGEKSGSEKGSSSSESPSSGGSDKSGSDKSGSGTSGSDKSASSSGDKSGSSSPVKSAKSGEKVA
jgi:putative FmdB family regulatory protein